MHPLDPLGAIVFVALFAFAALATARRPAWGFCALVAGVPFALYRDVFGTTATIPKALLLGVALGLTAYAGRLPSLRAGAVRALLVAAGFVVLATALSALHAGSHGASLRETLKAIEYAAAFAAAYLCVKLDPDENLFAATIAAVVSIVSLAALAQEFGGAPSGMWFNNAIVPRIAGPLEGPNQLAGYLEVGIAVLAALACARPRAIVSVALGLAVFADALTFSRSGLVGALVALATIAIVYRGAALRLLAPVLAGAAASVAVTFAWAESAHTTASTILRIPARLPAASDVGAGTNYAGGVGTRSELWRAAFALWRTHPIWGVGAGNFELDLPQAGLTGVRTHANSLYIQALVEGGIPLLAATLWLVWTSIARFVRGAAASPFVAGALAASLALAVHQTVDYVVFYPKVGEWWWIVLALGAACA